MRAMPRAATALAILGTALAMLLTPPIARWTLCLEPPVDTEVTTLWVASACTFLASWFVVRPLARRRAAVVKVALVVGALLFAEVSARLTLRVMGGWTRERVARIARVTHASEFAFRAHPFLHFTGRPSHTLQGNDRFGAETPFNERGFPDPDLPRKKPDGTCRIACLGGSTTILYPSRMLAWLESRADDQAFEVLNLSQGYYTSNHSVVNFALNARDYSPDYVVVHHGWNDSRAGMNAAEFRGDYSHVFRAFEPPELADVFWIRASVLYRVARFLRSRDQWAYLDPCILQPVEKDLGFDLAPALDTFSRNLSTIIDLALAGGITPVLATIPHSTDPEAAFAASRPDIERFAARMREVAIEYGSRVVFVDLARDLAGQNELYRDVGHMQPEGLERKGAAIGAAILTHWRNR